MQFFSLTECAETTNATGVFEGCTSKTWSQTWDERERQKGRWVNQVMFTAGRKHSKSEMCITKDSGEMNGKEMREMSAKWTETT